MHREGIEQFVRKNAARNTPALAQCRQPFNLVGKPDRSPCWLSLIAGLLSIMVYFKALKKSANLSTALRESSRSLQKYPAPSHLYNPEILRLAHQVPHLNLICLPITAPKTGCRCELV